MHFSRKHYRSCTCADKNHTISIISLQCDASRQTGGAPTTDPAAFGLHQATILK
jgi:hypothetical protein